MEREQVVCCEEEALAENIIPLVFKPLTRGQCLCSTSLLWEYHELLTLSD